MELELNDDDFETLLILAYAGDWLINASRTEPIEEYDEGARRIYSFAEEAGLGDYVVYDEEEDRYFASEELEQVIREYVEHYEENAFWDMLIRYLAERDIREEFDEETVNEMDSMEWFKTLEEYENRYVEEFQEHGVERLTVDKTRDVQ